MSEWRQSRTANLAHIVARHGISNLHIPNSGGEDEIQQIADSIDKESKPAEIKPLELPSVKDSVGELQSLLDQGYEVL